MKKIYCFINGSSGMGYHVLAVAEDGQDLAGHCSSSISFAKHDIGINSDWNHAKYLKKYPEGYQLEWVDDVPSHKELMAIIELENSKLPENEINMESKNQTNA